MTCLEESDISNNELGDDGAVKISNGVAKTNSKNEITVVSATVISKGLVQNTSLEDDNVIGQDGATAIAQATTNNRH